MVSFGRISTNSFLSSILLVVVVIVVVILIVVVVAIVGVVIVVAVIGVVVVMLVLFNELRRMPSIISFAGMAAKVMTSVFRMFGRP
ncbi:hypothetical protein Tco_1147079 [Tanacetum coccineum]